jgi:isocitrate dehydrogenase
MIERVADTPKKFDVIVMPYLYGDIISDIAAQIAGSVGMAGSANIGDHCAMFEAIHGRLSRRPSNTVWRLISVTQLRLSQRPLQGCFFKLDAN